MNSTYGGRGPFRSLLLVLVAPAGIMVEKSFLGNGSKKQPVASRFMGYNRLLYKLYIRYLDGFPGFNGCIAILKNTCTENSVLNSK